MKLRFDARLKMVHYAQQHGVAPAARHFGVTPKTVRLWRDRYEAANGARNSLVDRSRRPHHSPNKTPEKVERKVIKARKVSGYGASRLGAEFDLPVGESACRRIFKEEKMIRPRKHKHETKRDLRAVKQGLDFGECLEIDVKYLDDSPFYVQAMMRQARKAADQRLPRFEYTFRDVRTGGVWLGFSNELGELQSKCFISAVLEHLNAHGLQVGNPVCVQSDNGSEFGGASRNVHQPHGFPQHVRHLGAEHCFIPPGAKNHQSDVESFHSTVERNTSIANPSPTGPTSLSRQASGNCTTTSPGQSAPRPNAPPTRSSWKRARSATPTYGCSQPSTSTN